MKARSQMGDVTEYLRKHKTITSMQAWEMFHVTRLASIIQRLRKRGYNIVTVTRDGINVYGPYQYAEYVLEGEPYAVISN